MLISTKHICNIDIKLLAM